MKPRQALYFEVGEKELVNISAGGDPMNGPFPLYCRPVIEHTLATEAWVIEFAIEFAIIDCSAGQLRAFATARWSQSVDMDEDGYSVIRTQGRAEVNPKALGARSPDDLRESIIPPVPSGFERRSHYLLAANGLALDFLFIDKELNYNPPAIATRFKAAAEYAAERNGLAVASVQLEMHGKKTTARNLLLGEVWLIANDKLNWMGIVRNEKGNFNGTVRQSEMFGAGDANVVRLSITATTKDPKPQLLDIATLVRKAGTPASAIGAAPPDVGSRGTALLKLAAAALQDPCAATWARQQIQVGAGVPVPVQELPRVAIVDELPRAPAPAMGWDRADGVIDVCKIVVTDVEDLGKTALPVAGTMADGRTSVAVQLYNPVRRKSFAWTAEKVGGPPAIPDSRPLLPGVELMSRRVEPQMIEEEADGKLRYIVTGAYEYVYTIPDRLLLAYPVPPWRQFSLGELASWQTVGMGEVDPAAGGAGQSW